MPTWKSQQANFNQKVRNYKAKISVETVEKRLCNNRMV